MTQTTTQTNFTQLPNILFDSYTEIPDMALVGFFRLVRHCGHRGGVFVGSIRKLGKLLRMAKSTIARIVPLWVRAGLVSKEIAVKTNEDREEMVLRLCMGQIWQKNAEHYAHCPKSGQVNTVVPNRDNTVPEITTLVPSWDIDVPRSSSEVSTNTLRNTMLNTESNTGEIPVVSAHADLDEALVAAYHQGYAGVESNEAEHHAITQPLHDDELQNQSTGHSSIVEHTSATSTPPHSNETQDVAENKNVVEVPIAEWDTLQQRLVKLEQTVLSLSLIDHEASSNDRTKDASQVGQLYLVPPTVSKNKKTSKSKPAMQPEDETVKARRSALQQRINEWRGYSLTKQGAIINERKCIAALCDLYPDDTTIEEIYQYLFHRHWRWSKPDNRYTVGAQVILDEGPNVMQILRTSRPIGNLATDNPEEEFNLDEFLPYYKPGDGAYEYAVAQGKIQVPAPA